MDQNNELRETCETRRVILTVIHVADDPTLVERLQDRENRLRAAEAELGIHRAVTGLKNSRKAATLRARYAPAHETHFTRLRDWLAVRVAFLATLHEAIADWKRAEALKCQPNKQPIKRQQRRPCGRRIA